MSATDGSSEPLLLSNKVVAGHRKLAGGGIGGMAITPMILWLWSAIDTSVFPGVDLAMPLEVAAWLGTVIPAVIFYYLKEDQVVQIQK